MPLTDSIIQTQTVSDTTANWLVPLSFAGFDASLGTLQDVRVTITGDFNGTTSIENLGASAAQFDAGFVANFAVTGPDGTTLASTETGVGATVDLGAFDGTADFAGASGTVVSGMSNTITSVATYAPGDVGLEPFIDSGTGSGTVTFTAGSTVMSDVTSPGNLLSRSQVKAGAVISVQYDYNRPVSPPGGWQEGGAGATTGIFSPALTAAFTQTTAPQTVSIADAAGDWTNTVIVNRFDPSLGTLLGVQVSVRGDIQANFSAENLGAAAGTATLFDTEYLTLRMPDDGETVGAAPTIHYATVLGGFDGTIDFAGGSGSSTTGLTQSQTGEQDYRDGGASDLSSFIGSGTIALPISAVGAAVSQGPGNLETKLTSTSGAVVSIRYVYIPVIPAGSGSEPAGGPTTGNPATGHPTIAGTVADQAISDQVTVAPFANVVIGDLTAGQIETVTVTLSAAANGILTNLGGGSYNATTGVYTGTGSAAAVTNAVDGLVFTPTGQQVAPGQTVTTGFTITDIDTASASVTDTVTSVIATAATIAPPVILLPPFPLPILPNTLPLMSISGTVAKQAVTDRTTIAPFANVVISDLIPGQTETLTVTLSTAANGTLSNLGGGHYNATTGVYTDTGSVASVTAALQGLVFNPTAQQTAPGQTVTTTFAITDTNTASVSSTDSKTSVIAAASRFAITDTTTGGPGGAAETPYSGPVAGIEWQYITATTDSLNITATAPNAFIHSGSGDDAIDVSRVNGNNVLDGGTGSNFLVGGTGNDTFFVDDRLASSNIWSTVVNFHSGDSATMWGVSPSDFTLGWVNGQGATGYTGLTLHATAPGLPTALLTLAGLSSADLKNGTLSVTYGTTAAAGGVAGSTYMLIHAN